MAELPTAVTPSTTPEAARALAAIEASKLLAEPDVAECLDAIGELIRITGAPESIFDWVQHLLAGETLRQYAALQHIRLHVSRAGAEDQPSKTFVIWAANGDAMAIVPEGQHPAVSLLQMREDVARRAEEKQLAASFQASATAGHVETVDAWHARTSSVAR
ncbi:hypothetical protein AB0912_00150 [Streptomyces sp. NPDC007084]|uniref:hypothetical protein n=1 Tax=Streptomyces sp. NPDC007084 TaxID=3154313 RepID=UPI00345329F0